MTLTLTFAISGLAIVALLLAKRVQQKYRVASLFLNIFSKGDEQARELSHRMAVFYDEGKEKTLFFIRKQLPMRLKSNWNKLSAVVTSFWHEYLDKIRDARLIRSQDDGLSEFFKSINEVEKGGGEIEEVNFDHYEEPLESSLQEAGESVK